MMYFQVVIMSKIYGYFVSIEIDALKSTPFRFRFQSQATLPGLIQEVSPILFGSNGGVHQSCWLASGYRAL